MRSWAGVVYWAATDALVGFGLIGLMSIGLPSLVVGAIVVFVRA